MTVTRMVWTFIESRDLTVMRRVHRWRAPRWMRMWMLTATRMGDGWLWYSVGIVVLLFGGADRYTAFAASAVAEVGAVTLFQMLKKVSGRKRPCALEAHCWAKVLPPDQFSFPSGHSMSAFAIAVPLILLYPDFRIALLFAALSIAASRIILGMHFLSDVVVGCVLGMMLGYGSFLLFQRLY